MSFLRSQLLTLNSVKERGSYELYALNPFFAATATLPLSRFGTQNHTAGKRCSSRSILVRRKKELWQKRPRECLSWQVGGTPRHLNIGLSGVRNATSPTASLLTPNGREKD